MLDLKELEKYEIFPAGDGMYLVSEYSTKTDFFLDCEKAEEQGICTEHRELEDVEFEELVVEKGNVLLLTPVGEKDNLYYTIRVDNLDNNTFGTFTGAYFSDDSRLYTVNSVANRFKDIEDVIVCNCLIYNEKEVKSYIDALKELE